MALSYDSGILIWPNGVKPNSVTLAVNHPTTVSRSQNGKKYVRSWQHTNYGLEVAYPPMSAAEFQPFYAAVLALRGQSQVCWFDLIGTDGEKMLMNFFGDDTMTPLVNTAITTVSTGAIIRDVVLKNLPISTVEPIPAGSMISGLGRNYGHVQFVVNCTNSNGSGVATITLADPLAENVAVDAPVDVDPTRILVSLADDSLITNIDTIRLYGFGVRFEFDRTYS